MVTVGEPVVGLTIEFVMYKHKLSGCMAEWSKAGVLKTLVF